MRLQIARFLASSDNYGTIQPRRRTTRLSQTENVCELARHPPVCRNSKSGNRCIYGNNCFYRHADGEEKPSKRSKSESTQGADAILKEKKVQGCVSQNSDPKKSLLRKTGQMRLNASAGHATKFLGRTWYEIQIRKKKKGPS